MVGRSEERESGLRDVVWNAREGRARLPLRLLAGFGLWVGVAFLISTPLDALLTGPRPIFDLRGTYLRNASINLVSSVASAVVTPVAVYLAGRYVDRRPFRDYGFRLDRQWWTDLAFGFALGGALMTGIFLVELALGWVTVTGLFVVGGVPQVYFLPFFLLSVFGYLAGSFAEELLLRGFALTNLAEGLQVGPVGPRGAVTAGVAATAGLFGLGHATAPNATAVSTLSVGLAGVFLALGYVFTGELAVPVGVHVAWNFFEGNLYGFPISGSTTTSVVGIDQHGPDVVTGGAFGPEAGIAGVVAILVGIAATAAWARYSRGRVGIHPSLARFERRSTRDPADAGETGV